jgi:hypothetical protein
MKKDDNLIAEAYINSSSASQRINPQRAKYVIFTDEYEAYLTDPYKQVVLKDALNDREVSKWVPCDLVIGEDLQDLGGSVQDGDQSDWYVASPSTPKDHVHRALVGYR